MNADLNLTDAQRGILLVAAISFEADLEERVQDGLPGAVRDLNALRGAMEALRA